jgi:serine protease DegQ
MKIWLPLSVAALFVLPARGDTPKPAAAPPPVQVPYRLTATNHVLVRAKINGKGPFNFVLDTGAPALFVGTKIAEKAGVTGAKGRSATFDRFEIEGGLTVDKAEGRVDDLFQLEGMNGLGLAGVELHGVIGYNVLARYRIEYDFTRDKLAWTPLDFAPPKLAGITPRGGSAGLEVLGTLMKFLGAFLGMKANFAVVPRGFLGAELGDGDGGVVVRRVLPGGPAAKAGIAAGDCITRLAGEALKSSRALGEALAEKAAGETVTLTIQRGGKEIDVVIDLGQGL